MILCAIWDDPAFCALSSIAQRTYLMLVTQSDISACGSLPLTLRRWANTLPAADRGQLEPSLAELVEHRFVLIDTETEELFVRTFAKHDGGYKHAKRVLAVIAFAEAIRSLSIRSAVAIELDKLGVKTAIPLPTDSEPIANQQAIGSRRVVVTEVSTTPQPTSHIGEPPPIRAKCKKLHAENEPCGLCRQDRLDDERLTADAALARRSALVRNDPGMAELTEDLAKPRDRQAFAAAKAAFQATQHRSETA